jgi:hypothetical protein
VFICAHHASVHLPDRSDSARYLPPAPRAEQRMVISLSSSKRQPTNRQAIQKPKLWSSHLPSRPQPMQSPQPSWTTLTPSTHPTPRSPPISPTPRALLLPSPREVWHMSLRSGDDWYSSPRLLLPIILHLHHSLRPTLGLVGSSPAAFPHASSTTSLYGQISSTPRWCAGPRTSRTLT